MTRHSLLWLLIIVCVFLFAPLIVTSSEYADCINTEVATAKRWYGDEEFSNMTRRAQTIYGLFMVKTGVDGVLRKHFAKPAASTTELAPGFKMPEHLAKHLSHVDGYWTGLLDNVYLFCLRLAHACLWLYYMTPFLLATIFDGLMNRKSKIASFKYTSPTLYNASWHLIIFIIATSMVAFSITVSLTAFSYPIAIALIGLLIRLLISNIQHSA